MQGMWFLDRHQLSAQRCVMYEIIYLTNLGKFDTVWVFMLATISLTLDTNVKIDLLQ